MELDKQGLPDKDEIDAMNEQNKEEMFFYQMGAARSEILVLFILLEAVILFGIIESNATLDNFFLCLLPFFLFFGLSLLPNTPYNIRKLLSKIYVSENGLTCKSRDSVEWQYSWDEIEQFHRINRYKDWWIDIYTQDGGTAFASFQITLSAQKLMKQVCPRVDLVAQILKQ